MLVTRKLLIIHGPNMNLLGVREKSIYGSEGIDDINVQIAEYAKKLNFDCRIFQSNHEGDIVDAIQQASSNVDGIIINAGAYSHYSLTIRDAISATNTPCIEVHCSNVFDRENFRCRSVIAPVCAGSIVGFGKYSYLLAISAMENIVKI